MFVEASVTALLGSLARTMEVIRQTSDGKWLEFANFLDLVSFAMR